MLQKIVEPITKKLTNQFDTIKARYAYSSSTNPTLTPYLIYWVLVLLLFLSVFVGLKTFKSVPPAKIHIDATGLSAMQYQSLTQTVDNAKVGSFYSADLQNIRDDILTLPWVDEVRVVREWQRGIVIHALARQPVARFGSEKLVDATGYVYPPVDENVLKDAGLTQLQGEVEKAEVIMQMMQQVNVWFEPLDMSVDDIILTPRMTWLIRFDNGMRMIVDGEGTAQKLVNVSQLLQKQLAKKTANIQVMDLRYKNGFVISWKKKHR